MPRHGLPCEPNGLFAVTSALPRDGELAAVTTGSPQRRLVVVLHWSLAYTFPRMVRRPLPAYCSGTTA